MVQDFTEIIIRLDGGHDIGMGHAFRMLTLAQTFRLHGISVQFVVRENSITQDLLEQNLFRVHSAGRSSTEIEIIDTIHRRNSRIDLWIYDILSTEAGWHQKLKSFGIPTVSFDDAGPGSADADITINAIFGCGLESRAGLHRELNGPEYVILPPAVVPAVGNSNVPVLGVSMGGSDTHNVTEIIAEHLKTIKASGLAVRFFIGPHYEQEHSLRTALAGFPHPHEVKSNVPDLLKELSEPGAVICGGGQTIFELAFLGKAILACANEPHEVKAISFFEKRGACINLGCVQEKIHLERIDVFLKNFPGEGNSLLAERARQLVDGKGLERCYAACRSLLKPVSRQ